MPASGRADGSLRPGRALLFGLSAGVGLSLTRGDPRCPDNTPDGPADAADGTPGDSCVPGRSWLAVGGGLSLGGVFAPLSGWIRVVYG